jgi:hypothetical protein
MRPEGCCAPGEIWMPYLWPRTGCLMMPADASICWRKLRLVPPPMLMTPVTRERAATCITSRMSCARSKQNEFFFSKRAPAMPTVIALSEMVGQKMGTRAL